MRALGLATLVLAVLASASRGADDAVDKELKRFQGNWQLVEITNDGKTVTGDALKGKVWSFQGDKLIPQDNKDDVATVKIDPAKRPATLDITDKNGRTDVGICKFIGDDKLTICARSGTKRPTEFAAGVGSGAFLIVLERVKK